MTRPKISSVATWQPLLRAELREQALDTIRDIADELTDPPPSPSIEGMDAEAITAFNLALFTGRAGIAVFFAYLAEAGLREDAEDLAWSFLEGAEAGISAHWTGASLCEGFSGIAWAHAHLHQTLSGRPDRGALKEIDETLIALLREWPLPHQFELLYGLAGIGVYALERLPSRRARTILRLVIDLMGKSAERQPEGIAWRAPTDAREPRRDFNLGMAHGVPGVIAFLARAAAAGVDRKKTLSLLGDAVRWLRTQRLPPELGGGFPASTTPGEPSMPSRVAWCYGDPGVSAALLAAGGVLDLPEVEEEAIQVALAVAERSEDQTGVADAGLCHGAGGLGHFYNRIFQASGRPGLGTVATRWFARLFEFRREGAGIAGFTPAPAPGSEAGEAIDPARARDPGLLSGAAGIGLALLAATTPVMPAWDRVLLLDLTTAGVRRLPTRVTGSALETR